MSTFHPSTGIKKSNLLTIEHYIYTTLTQSVLPTPRKSKVVDTIKTIVYLLTGLAISLLILIP
jgi:hypothetical protein